MRGIIGLKWRILSKFQIEDFSVELVKIDVSAHMVEDEMTCGGATQNAFCLILPGYISRRLAIFQKLPKTQFQRIWKSKIVTVYFDFFLTVYQFRAHMI